MSLVTKVAVVDGVVVLQEWMEKMSVVEEVRPLTHTHLLR